eukprot:5525156-Amphidinium_carterae.1
MCFVLFLRKHLGSWRCSERKGPIKTTFDNLAGKGLPEFCLLGPEINTEYDSLDVGIEVQNQPSK